MKIQSPWMGRIRGSAGNMTGCKVYDKNVMRAKAFGVNNPKTAAQQVQRGYFADLTKLVASFTPEQLRTLFPSKPKAMSRRNALAKQLDEYNVMDGTEKIVDFAEIDTLGNAPTASLPLMKSEVEGNNYSITWDPNNFGGEKNINVRVIAALVNETKGNIQLSNVGSKLGSGELSIPLPSDWEPSDNINAIPFITNAETPNLVFGSFIIKVRPEKKSN